MDSVANHATPRLPGSFDGTPIRAAASELHRRRRGGQGGHHRTPDTFAGRIVAASAWFAVRKLGTTGRRETSVVGPLNRLPRARRYSSK